MQRQGYLPVRQTVVTASSTTLTNALIAFAGPIAWPAAKPLAAVGLLALSQGYSTHFLPSEWFYGQKTGLMPPDMFDQGQVNQVRDWLHHWELFAPPDCGYWEEPSAAAKQWARLAIQAFENRAAAYEEDLARVNAHWGRYAMAWTKFAAIAALGLAAIAVLGGLAGPTGLRWLAWGGAATALSTITDDFRSGRVWL